MAADPDTDPEDAEHLELVQDDPDDVDNDLPVQPTQPWQREFRGHPIGLTVLFFAEMWERFSYYGMRTLLVMFLREQLLQPGHIETVIGLGVMAGPNGIYGDPAEGDEQRQAIASRLYGLYTGLVYFTPVCGGAIADRVGRLKSVMFGAVLMAFGHFFMVVESLFVCALVLLILGNGLFKPNVSTLVGGLYGAEDPRRDQAFSIFYAGINLGALLSPLVCGTLGEKVGYHAGFAAAGIGMLIGLAVLVAGQKYIPSDLNPADSQTESQAEVPLGMNREDKRRVVAVAVVSGFCIVFWAVYEQQGNTIQLFAVDRSDMLLVAARKKHLYRFFD